MLERPTHVEHRFTESEGQYVRAIEWMQEKISELEKDMELLREYADVPEVERTYQALRERLLKLRDGFEDVSATLPTDSPVREKTWAIEQRLNESFSRMLTKDADRKSGQKEESSILEGHEAFDEYEGKVVDLMQDAIRVQDALEASSRVGLSPESRELVNERLDDIQERLQELDQEYVQKNVHPANSRERKILSEMIKSVRTASQEKPTSALSAARATHQKVRAMYASVSHALSEDQRRDFRTRITELTSLVRQAEDEHWRHLFSHRVPRPADQEIIITMASQDRVQAIVASMALATELAPAITWASSQPIPPPMPPEPQGPTRMGVFSALVNALKLK